MCHILKPLHVTSSLKNNFIFATLSIHTIQIIKYHYHIFSLFNSKFKFQNFSNPSIPPTFSLIPTNTTFKSHYLSHSFQTFFFLPVKSLFLSLSSLIHSYDPFLSVPRITHPPLFSLPPSISLSQFIFNSLSLSSSLSQPSVSLILSHPLCSI
jgi:hypothetical protein